jgi:ubiquinone/menaquinone biosynthesis C-methylase UbiE
MDAAEDGMWWYRAAHARILDALRARPGVPGPLLDAGCGTGGLLKRLAQEMPEREAIGLDFVFDATRRARAKSGRLAVAGDINRLPFADASFGAIVSIDVLYHISVDPAAALAELLRVLRPGGTLVMNLPAYDWLMSAHDIRTHTARRFTRGRAVRLLRDAGFADIRSGYWNGLLLPLMVVQRKIVKRRPDASSDVTHFPPLIDRGLMAASMADRWLGRHGMALPFGGSVLSVATRP